MPKHDLIEEETWWDDGPGSQRDQARELVPLLHRMQGQNRQFLLGILIEVGVSGFDLCQAVHNKQHKRENHAAWEGRLVTQQYYAECERRNPAQPQEG